MWPIFDSVEKFDENAGAKLKALIKLLKYHLSDDRAEPVVDWDEANKAMVYPATRGGTITQNRKILLYFTFAMMRRTIVSVSN